MKIPLVTFVGRSGAGKTTLLVQLIAELSRRGYRVAAIKHHSHSGFEFDKPNKDSWRFAQAGSRHVVIAGPDKIARYCALDRELTLEEIAAGISDVDIILAEGYKQARVPAVEVIRESVTRELVSRPEDRIAVATDMSLDMGAPRFSLDDIQGLAGFLESRFLTNISAGAGRRPPQALDDARPGDGSVTLSYRDALGLTLENVKPLGTEVIDLAQTCGRVAALDLYARVDSPSLDVSLKDGYAVRPDDVAAASPGRPVRLALAGLAAAGQPWLGEVQRGTAVRILSGAPLPRGAGSVVSAEFASDDGQIVTVVNDAKAGRNVLPRGGDISQGQRIVAAGDPLRPPAAGLLAAAGHEGVPVFRQPRVAVLATGDEVVAPGHRLAPGKLYASNLVTLAAWCACYGLRVDTAVVPDSGDEIRAQLLTFLSGSDAILTSGGAWKGERDLVVSILDDLGWQKVYHRVRMGPGKAVGFGMWQGKPVFCLPGGPPSNHMAFLQLALPGIHRLEGRRRPGLPVQFARLAEPVSGQRDWTQFVHGRLEPGEGESVFYPVRAKSRLQELAQMEAIVTIAEGTRQLPAGAVLPVQVLAGAGGMRE